MDPILLSLVGLVILFSSLLVITLTFWIRSVTREKNECRVIIVSLKRKLREKSEYSQDWGATISNLIDFVLAYYKRIRARGHKKEPANAIMALYWKRLPKVFQEKLAILGGLADLQVGDSSSP